MMFKNETPLRGWKEICPLLNVQHKRTAMRILKEKELLQYEGRIPVLLASAYLQTLAPKK